MAEQNDSTASELNLEASANAEQASATYDTSDSQDYDSEQGNTDLSFLDGDDNDSKPESKELQKKKSLIGQVNAAQKAIESGKKSVESYPEYIQEELKERGFIDDVTTETINEDKQAKSFDEDAIIQKAIERMREQETFDSLKRELSSMELSSEQAKQLESEYKELKSSGLSQHKALTTAVKLAGLTSQIQEARKEGIQAGKMVLTPSGQVQTLKRTRGKDPMKMSDEEFLQWSDSQASSTTKFTNVT